MDLLSEHIDMRSVGPLALAQSRARSRAAFSSSKEEVSSAPRALDVWMITGSSRSLTVAEMAAPPAVVPPVADPYSAFANSCPAATEIFLFYIALSLLSL